MAAKNRNWDRCSGRGKPKPLKLNKTQRALGSELRAREALYRANRERFGESGTSVAAFDRRRGISR